MYFMHCSLCETFNCCIIKTLHSYASGTSHMLSGRMLQNFDNLQQEHKSWIPMYHIVLSI